MTPDQIRALVKREVKVALETESKRGILRRSGVPTSRLTPTAEAPDQVLMTYWDGTQEATLTKWCDPVVQEAPSDGSYYAMKDGEWVDITSLLNIL